MTRTDTRRLPKLQLDCFEAEALADWHTHRAEVELDAVEYALEPNVEVLRRTHMDRAADLRVYAIQWRQKEGVPSMASEEEANV